MTPLLPFPDVIDSAYSGESSAPAIVAIIVMKATIVLAIGGVAALVARRAGAAVRHAILALTLAGALGLPVLMLTAPDWRFGILPPFTVRHSTTVMSTTVARISRATLHPATSTYSPL